MSEEQSEIEAALTAVTPIDGRYRRQSRVLAPYFSELALIRRRVRVEIEWYLALALDSPLGVCGPLDDAAAAAVRAIYQNFGLADAVAVKKIEAETNHDVKAVEYFVKQRLKQVAPALPIEMVHFACTSEDINNLAYALALKEFAATELLPRLERLRRALAEAAKKLAALPMLARTHGQPASPTTVGKELAVFAYRLGRQTRRLAAQEYLGKFNGAVGNYNAHALAFPEVDWLERSRRFVEGFELVWNPLTTQTESHDWMAELFDTLGLTGAVLLDLARDLWGYIALGYFGQESGGAEVGSSVMPHKVNPIDFENCEGNLGVAAALFRHLAEKLPVSRWQRDLSDSTALRAIGEAFGHLIVALNSLERGLGRLRPDTKRLAADLEDPQTFEVLAEGIQTVMRRYNLNQPYETLKELTRGRKVTPEALRRLVRSLPLDEEVKARLEKLTPRDYVGLASELVKRFA